MSGCTCEGSGPFLAATDAGEAAIGWSLDGDEVLHSVAYVEAGVVVWRIEAIEARRPVPVVLGEAPQGFTTSVATDRRIDVDALGSVVIAYGGTEAPEIRYDVVGADLAGQFERGSARTPSVEQVDDCGFGLPVGAIGRVALGAAIVIVGIAFFVIGGAIGLLSLVHTAIGRSSDVPRTDASPSSGRPRNDR